MHRQTASSTGVRPGAARLALAFVLLSLVALVLIPLVVQRRVEVVRSSVEDLAGPARTLVTRLQFHLSREMSSLRGFLLTGDTRFLETYSRSQDEVGRTYIELEPLVRHLDRTVLEAFVETRTLSDQWHARADDEEIARRMGAGAAGLDEVSTEQRLFEQVLESASRLDLAIATATRASREQIRAMERVGLVLTGFLGVLALGSAITVGWLDQRVRALATETELRRAEAERALEASASANEARARLLRGVTHDVKNPLGAAKGYAELLELGVRGELTVPQIELVRGMRRSVDAALSIIGDLLDLARADAGGLAIERLRVELGALVADAAEDHRPRAAAAGLTLECEAPERPVWVYTDPGRVRQVLDNLLSNAIKYTPGPGSVNVRVEEGILGQPERPGSWIAIRVRDTGPGIPLDKREAIFDEFTRLHEGVGGHGLGLAISRRIARLMGGDLTVDGAEGEGATFALWLPLRADALDGEPAS